MDNTLKGGVADVKRIGDKIIAAEVILGEKIRNIVSTYRQQVGIEKEIKTILKRFRRIDTTNT